MQEQLRNLLLNEFKQSKSFNENYSMRAFARKLNCPPSVVSEIMRGKRRITKTTADKILSAMSAPETLKKKILSEIPHRAPNGSISHQRPFHFLDARYIEVTSRWYYFAILSLMETKDFKSDCSWIANRLGLKKELVQSAIGLMLELKLIESKNGNYLILGSQYRVGQDVVDLAVRRNHFENIELQKKSLENHSVENRDFSSMTMTFSKHKMEEAKKMIQSFRRKFCGRFETKENAEVYRLSIQFFPLTKVGCNEKSD